MTRKKVVLITGASSGIGKATAQKLLSEGHIVYAAARRIDQMKELHKAGAVTFLLDVTVEDQIQACIEKIISEHGRIDVLFNNAGFGLFGSMEEISPEEAKYQFDVNLIIMPLGQKGWLFYTISKGNRCDRTNYSNS